MSSRVQRNECETAVSNRHRQRSRVRMMAIGLILTAALPPVLPASERNDDTRVSSRKSLLEAKRQEKAANLEPYQVTRLEKEIRNYERRPWWSKLTEKGYRGFRLELGGLSRESGFAFGGGHVYRPEGPVQIHTRALYSTSGDSLFEARLGFFNSENSPFQLNVRTSATDLNRLSFYGPGSDSSPDSRRYFGLNSRLVALEARYRPIPALEFGAATERVRYLPGSADSEISPSPVSPDGYHVANYWVQKFDVKMRFLDDVYPRAGVETRLATERYHHLSDAPASFTRFSAEIATQVPLGVRSRRLAAGASAVFTAPDSGHQVPFYLLTRLGGSRSLRGFPEHRFHDLHRILFNVEYRWEVWTYMDFVLFSDFGKVFHRAADLDLSDLRKSAGFGVMLHTPAGLRLRFDIARSSEGFQFHVGVGPLR